MFLACLSTQADFMKVGRKERNRKCSIDGIEKVLLVLQKVKLKETKLKENFCKSKSTNLERRLLRQIKNILLL